LASIRSKREVIIDSNFFTHGNKFVI
jgi:hypothetical protein